MGRRPHPLLRIPKSNPFAPYPLLFTLCAMPFISAFPIPHSIASVICLPSSAICRPSPVFRLLSSVFCLPSSVLRLPSSVFCPPSSVFCPPSSVFRLLSSVLCPPSSVFRHPSSVICLLSSVICLLPSVICLRRHPDIVSDIQFNHIARRCRINGPE